MSAKSLKQKLEEKIQYEGDEDSVVIGVEESNIVPFVKGDNQALSILPDFVITMNEARERIAMLQEFVKSMMIPNIDYGIIPKCDKPTLFKSGGEKLCDIFGFSKQVEVINRIEDWEKGVFHYEIKVTLVNKRTGHIEAEGIGCCNNQERKYKNQDAYSIVNTILKISKKRAFIDAVLSATRSSALFTQDIEDFDTENPTSKNTSAKIPSASKPMEQKLANPISKNQQSQIFTIVGQKQIPVNEIKETIYEKYKVNESKQLSEVQANDFIEYLKAFNSI